MLRQKTAYGVSKLQVLGIPTEIKANQNDIEILNSLFPLQPDGARSQRGEVTNTICKFRDSEI
jgi:hypothetical protein